MLLSNLAETSTTKSWVLTLSIMESNEVLDIPILNVSSLIKKPLTYLFMVKVVKMELQQQTSLGGIHKLHPTLGGGNPKFCDITFQN